MFTTDEILRLRPIVAADLPSLMSGDLPAHLARMLRLAWIMAPDFQAAFLEQLTYSSDRQFYAIELCGVEAIGAVEWIPSRSGAGFVSRTHFVSDCLQEAFVHRATRLLTKVATEGEKTLYAA